MERSVFDILEERGFIEQVTHEQEVRELLSKESVTFYIGFDATADSLHVGHFIQLMVMMHMQRAGHRPICLLGGGTTKVGDPSGKSDMRQMLFYDQINENAAKFRKQMEKYLTLDGEKGIIDNNANWLDNLNYISFLREVGSKFNVNTMLQAECYKSRMEDGLNFLEFNYMIMQAYDFLELYKRYNCKMQLGGNDQWSNIIAGVNLVRKSEQAQVYGLTFKLLTTSEGKKMGKTESGAIWIDPDKTSPYEFYQYFRNVLDADVANCLALLTFLPMEEVRRLSALEGADINKAKEILAYEVTKIVHGEVAANGAQEAAKALFGGGGATDDMPTFGVDQTRVKEGVVLLDILLEAGFIPSRSEGRRLIEQSGLMMGEEKVTGFDRRLTAEDFSDGVVLVKKGKKNYLKLTIR